MFRSLRTQSLIRHARIKWDLPQGSPLLHITGPTIDWTAVKERVNTNVDFRAVDARENLISTIEAMEDSNDKYLWSNYANLHFRNGVEKHLLQISNTSIQSNVFASVNVDAVVKGVYGKPQDAFSWNEAIFAICNSIVVMFVVWMLMK